MQGGRQRMQWLQGCFWLQLRICNQLSDILNIGNWKWSRGNQMLTYIWQSLDVTISATVHCVHWVCVLSLFYSSTLKIVAWARPSSRSSPGHIWPYLRHLKSLTKTSIVFLLFMICISRQLCRFWMNSSMYRPGKSYLFSLQTYKEN